MRQLRTPIVTVNLGLQIKVLERILMKPKGMHGSNIGKQRGTLYLRLSDQSPPSPRCTANWMWQDKMRNVIPESQLLSLHQMA